MVPDPPKPTSFWYLSLVKTAPYIWCQVCMFTAENYNNRPFTGRDQMQTRLIVALFLTSMSACLAPNNDSDIKLVNGRVIGGDTAPAAVQIAMPIPGQKGAEARCTATWVSANTIITAAHCVEERGVPGEFIRVSDGLGLGAKSTKIILHPAYRTTGGGADLAVVIFPDGTVDNSKTATIPSAPPNPGAKISIVGYGKFDHLDGQSGGRKRLGTNTILQANNERITFLGSPRPESKDARTGNGVDSRSGTGVDVLNSQGDSGGPMFLGAAENQQIIGVSSSLNSNPEANGKHIGNYDSLIANKNWLLKTTQQGAVINGLNGKGSGSGGIDSQSQNDDQGTVDQVDPIEVAAPVGALVSDDNKVYFGFSLTVTEAFLCLDNLEACQSPNAARVPMEKILSTNADRAMFRVPSGYTPDRLAQSRFSVLGYNAGVLQQKSAIDMRAKE